MDGGHTGTCTLLTPHLLVTCLHVLRNLTDAATAQVTFYPAEELEGPTVPTTITLHPDVLFITSEEEDEKRRRVGEEELDFAIVAISIDLPPTSKVKPGVEPCLSKHNWQTDKPQKRVQVAGVHPERQAVEFYPPGDVKQMGLRTQGKWTYPLSYEANAEASYSGGAVLSQQMALLAIHQGGVVGQHNYGVPIQAILHCAQAVWEKQQRERGQDAGEVSGQAEADLVRLLMTRQMMKGEPSSPMVRNGGGAPASSPAMPARPVHSLTTQGVEVSLSFSKIGSDGVIEVKEAATESNPPALARLSAGDLNALTKPLWASLTTTTAEVKEMMVVAKYRTRSLFKSDELRWTFARDSIWSKGRLDSNPKYCEVHTVQSIQHWSQRCRVIARAIQQEAQVRDDDVFVAQFQALARELLGFIELLRRYRPMHGWLSWYIPREEFNGGEPLSEVCSPLRFELILWSEGTLGTRERESVRDHPLPVKMTPGRSGGDPHYRSALRHQGTSRCGFHRKDILVKYGEDVD